jgi:hypothetical protein
VGCDKCGIYSDENEEEDEEEDDNDDGDDEPLNPCLLSRTK